MKRFVTWCHEHGENPTMVLAMLTMFVVSSILLTAFCSGV